MTTHFLEEEFTRHAKDLVGRRVRLEILEDEPVSQPSKKALEVIRKVSERKRTMNETSGESSVDIFRRANEGEMFS